MQRLVMSLGSRYHRLNYGSMRALRGFSGISLLDFEEMFVCLVRRVEARVCVLIAETVWHSEEMVLQEVMAYVNLGSRRFVTIDVLEEIVVRVKEAILEIGLVIWT